MDQKVTRPRIEDRVSYIRSLENIEEVRKASRSAYAKRAKATTDELDFKYGEEVFEARERLDYLNNLIEESESPELKAIELGEKVPGVVQRVINTYSDINDRLGEHLRYIRMTHKQAKTILSGMDQNLIPKEIEDRLSALGPEYLEVYRARSIRGDQRVININRSLNFIDKFTPKYVAQNVILSDDRGIATKKKSEQKAREKARKERAERASEKRRMAKLER